MHSIRTRKLLSSLFSPSHSSSPLAIIANELVSSPLLTRSQSTSSSSSSPSSGGSGFSRNEAHLNDLYARALEPKPVKFEPKPAAEISQGKKLADVYTKLMWKRHFVLEKDLQRKLLLKWSAIAALPSVELQKEALVVDGRVPIHSRIAGTTPPSKGFHHTEIVAEIEQANQLAAAALEAKQIEEAIASGKAISNQKLKQMQQKSTPISQQFGIRRKTGRRGGEETTSMLSSFNLDNNETVPGILENKAGKKKN